jgi:hypothetical protein
MTLKTDPLFFGGECRIMFRASNQTLDTIPRGPAPQEETLSERVAVAAAFVLCVVLTIALGGVL